MTVPGSWEWACPPRPLTSAGLVAVVAATLVVCGSGSTPECEEALTAAATSVEGVVGAEFTLRSRLAVPRRVGDVPAVRQRRRTDHGP